MKNTIVIEELTDKEKFKALKDLMEVIKKDDFNEYILKLEAERKNFTVEELTVNGVKGTYRKYNPTQESLAQTVTDISLEKVISLLNRALKQDLRNELARPQVKAL